MSYVWEEELMPVGNGAVWQVEHHLKKVWNTDPMAHKFTSPMVGQWKISVAWVHKLGDRKYKVCINKSSERNNDKTFRSLKAAKAYAVAVVTLET